MTELLPCPFCGGEADEYEGDYGNGIYCMMCGAMVGEPIHLEYRTTKRVSIAEAIDAWNTRAERVGERKTINKTGDFVTHDSRAERTCRIVKTPSDSDFMDDWRYRCSECGCNIPVNERDPKTGDVINAANYCPNCGARVVSK